MRFCEIKGRYVFDGEESSEDEPIQGPPKAKKKEDNPKEETKQEPQELTGTAALTTVAFGGALANRNRAKGAKVGRP